MGLSQCVGDSNPIKSASLLAFSLAALVLTACAPAAQTTDQVGSCSNRISTIYQTTEALYCAPTANTFTSSVTLNGQAHYQTRAYTTSAGLSATLTQNPIRYAEVVAKDASGNIVQCAQTDTSGNFTMTLPQSTATTYTVQVNSRADNSMLHASVLNCPEENGYYSVTASVATTSSPQTVALVADSTSSGPMIGAAFNILDQIANANDFLRTYIGGSAASVTNGPSSKDCNTNFAGCTDVTAVPKVQAYWAKGFNPNQYFNDPFDGLSFYARGYYHLFILGGINGDVYSSDTDHFDNSVIIHEYGHFLEDVMGHSDSPGGAHYGNQPIDPRLAWSEGWGNFIQAAVRGDPHYRDTEGTPDTTQGSTSDYIFNIDLDTYRIESGNVGYNCQVGDSFAGCDVPSMAYEGNFREFATTRMLWDVVDGGTGPTSTDGDTVNNAFQELWAVFTGANYFRNPQENFRNPGLINELQMNFLTGHTDWSSLRTMHKQGDSQHYAYYVVPTSPSTCAAGYAMTPYADPNDDGTIVESNLTANNRFLYYKHPGGALNLHMTYTTDNTTTGTESDIDLYLYNSTAQLGNSTTIVGSSNHYYSNNPAVTDSETISLGSLPAGDYLIDTFIYTGVYTPGSGDPSSLNGITSGQRISPGTALHFKIQANGVDLCPSPTRP